MRRIIAATVALAACAGAAALAAPNAVFLLTNGQTASGTIVYGRGSNNIVDGRFHLIVGGTDQSFPMDEVAAVDFSGNGLAALKQSTASLPAGSEGMLFMRDGSSHRGHLFNIIEGDFVQWVNESGQRNNIPISQVSHFFLSGQVVRAALTAAGAAPAGVAAAGQPPSGAVRVEAKQPWTDTGVTVRAGDLVAFQTSGQIDIGAGVMSPADGNDQYRLPGLPVASMPTGGLIGKVANSAPFPIGSNAQPIRMPADGRLMLGVNDRNYSDNNGFFSVVVTQAGRRP